MRVSRTPDSPLRRARSGAAVLTLCAALPAVASDGPAPASPSGSRALVDEARSLASRFMTQLKGELQAAMQAGGPPAAIGVCRNEAPGIAGALSREQGWAVGRTALRVRNPRNAPDAHERAVLVRFQQRADAGEAVEGMEHHGIVEQGGQRYFHYMRAIPTGGLCLTCHGTSVDPATREAILATYPADAATGFTEGELRGAFTFVRPLDAAAADDPAGP